MGGSETGVGDGGGEEEGNSAGDGQGCSFSKAKGADGWVTGGVGEDGGGPGATAKVIVHRGDRGWEACACGSGGGLLLEVAETAGAGGAPLVRLGIMGSAHQEGEEGDQGEEHQEGG